MTPLCYKEFGYNDSQVGYFTAGAAGMGFISTYIVSIIIKKIVYRYVVPFEYVFIIICAVLFILFLRGVIGETILYFIYQFFVMGAS